jgi:hypothetical protein
MLGGPSPSPYVTLSHMMTMFITLLHKMLIISRYWYLSVDLFSLLPVFGLFTRLGHASGHATPYRTLRQDPSNRLLLSFVSAIVRGCQHDCVCTFQVEKNV